MTPEERRKWSQVGADISWARTADRTKRTAPGREGLMARLEREVREIHGDDLPPDAFAKCFDSHKRAYFRRMALIGVQTKAAKKAAQFEPKPQANAA